MHHAREIQLPLIPPPPPKKNAMGTIFIRLLLRQFGGIGLQHVFHDVFWGLWVFISLEEDHSSLQWSIWSCICIKVLQHQNWERKKQEHAHMKNRKKSQKPAGMVVLGTWLYLLLFGCLFAWFCQKIAQKISFLFIIITYFFSSYIPSYLSCYIIQRKSFGLSKSIAIELANEKWLLSRINNYKPNWFAIHS